MNHYIWSGRVATSYEQAMQHVMRCGDMSYVLMDTHQGEFPGTMYWNRRLGPLPAGWKVIRYDPWSAQSLIAQRYLPVLRAWSLAQSYWRWARALGSTLKQYWRMRPPLRIK